MSTITNTDLAALNEEFERAPVSKVVAWAVEQFGSSLTVASSMQDAVLIDIAHQVDPNIDVFFIDTGLHFTETWDTLRAVEDKYGIKVRVVKKDEQNWKELDPDHCCEAAKVAGLDDALVGRQGWITALKRVDAVTRVEVPIVGRDRRGLVKLNPLAAWTDDDVYGYAADHDVPVNPLVAKGYLSIGCAPCTVPVAPGQHPRSGRWAGTDKTECGLHV
ncbi:MAG: phosphoadenosine phosphosulfate reductase [Acidimicrobiaceae bacterium]|nr:phosphoadenosine phosphosulfate reductase [Acidimicrobiaceae bacterium]